MYEDLQSRLIADLVLESNESLDEFDQHLLLLEKGEESDETLHAMFRVIHSLKGSSGCLGLARITELAHAGENLLSLLRDEAIPVSPELVSTLLKYSDTLRAMIQALAAAGFEGEDDYSALVGDLRALAEATSKLRPAANAPFGLFDEEELARNEHIPPPAASTHEQSAPFAGASAGPGQPPPTNLDTNKDKSSPSPAIATAPETAIRVDVQQLDGMMDLVGELVLARNQIMQISGQLNVSSLVGPTQRLNIITTKLQETVMKTRMQPIGNVWSKFPRIVRDVSRELGKQVRLVMEGKETDLDRNIIEAIKDPLTHLVRNAVDHGLETPTQRAAAGKPAEGLLRLRSFHEGGQVNIEVYDDGAGIDREKVVNKAIQRGIIQAAQASQLSEREILSLIFAPGFSTADQVTSISGRGVGMDVVKKNVERIGGSVDVQSEPGQSTTIRIRIPLTLAIIPALIIRCAGRRYAIPQVSLVELVRIEAENSTRLIESINGSPVYRLRGNLLPVVYLREQLRIPSAAETSDSIFLLVLQAEGRLFGLVVDGISDTEEIVVKPLGKELKGMSLYAGATIMGDGCVALILDTLGLARQAHVLQESTEIKASFQGDSSTNGAASQDRQSLLLFSLGSGSQAAIPLSRVARLEEFESSAVEFSGSSEVVQYRGEIMPLVYMDRVLGMPSVSCQQEISREQNARLCVIVYNHQGSSVGLVVDRIIDTVDEAVAIQKSANRPGMLGAAVVRHRVTEFLDIETLLERSGVVIFAGAEE